MANSYRREPGLPLRELLSATRRRHNNTNRVPQRDNCQLQPQTQSLYTPRLGRDMLNSGSKPTEQYPSFPASKDELQKFSAVLQISREPTMMNTSDLKHGLVPKCFAGPQDGWFPVASPSRPTKGFHRNT